MRLNCGVKACACPVPYGEPAWLVPGFTSPYYNDGHRRFQKAARKFFDEVVYPDAVRCEESGKRISQDVVKGLRRHV